MRHNQVTKMVISAVLLAVGMVLPLLLGQVQVLGQAISPLHIPALLCGLTCGWPWGVGVGIVLPLLRSAVFGFPVMIPTAASMSVELGVYGLLTGLLYPVLRKIIKGGKLGHLPAMLAAMVIAMVVGRLAGGAMQAILLGMNGKPYNMTMFVNSYFIGTSVGAVIHLIVVPAVVVALERARLSPMR